MLRWPPTYLATLAWAVLIATGSSACGDDGNQAAPASPPPRAVTVTPDEPKGGAINFDKDPVGTIPQAFEITETNGAGKLATWKVVDDEYGPSPPHIFALTETRNTGQTYNLALVRGAKVVNVDASVMIKPNTGAKDRGGGIALRVQDKDNYYVARWNPIEHNARIYVVEDGQRTALGRAETNLSAGKWHQLRFVAEGPALELFIDDKPLVRLKDATHRTPGTVGLWTKSDAATLFDDFSFTPL